MGFPIKTSNKQISNYLVIYCNSSLNVVQLDDGDGTGGWLEFISYDMVPYNLI